MSYDGQERREEERARDALTIKEIARLREIAQVRLELTPEEIAKLKTMLANFVILSPEEIYAVRDIVEADKRMKWLWATARNLSVWIVGVVGGITLTYSSLSEMVKHLAGK